MQTQTTISVLTQLNYWSVRAPSCVGFFRGINLNGSSRQTIISNTVRLSEICTEHSRKTCVSIFYKSLSEKSSVVTTCILRRSTSSHFLLCPSPLSTFLPFAPNFAWPIEPVPTLSLHPPGMQLTSSFGGMQLTSSFGPIFFYLFGFGICFAVEPQFSNLLWVSVSNYYYFPRTVACIIIVILIMFTRPVIHGIVFIYLAFLPQITHFDLRRPQW
jgi:hypothetical protein